MKTLALLIIVVSIAVSADGQTRDTIPPGQEDPSLYLSTRIVLQTNWDKKLYFSYGMSTDTAIFLLDSIEANAKVAYRIESRAPMYVMLRNRNKRDMYRLPCGAVYLFDWDNFYKRWILTVPNHPERSLRIWREH